MTLSQLKAVCAAYHKKTVDELTQNGVDLFLVAANNARRNAELRHNFEYSRVLATLNVIAASGGSLQDAVVVDSSGFGTFNGIREVVAITRESSAGYQLPVDFTRADMALERERTMLDKDSDMWPVNRYPSDSDLLRRGGYGGIVQRGSRLFIYPAPVDSVNEPVTLQLQGYGWLAEYTADTLLGTPDTLLVTGTLSPDLTGTYNKVANFLDAQSQPTFIKISDGISVAQIYHVLNVTHFWLINDLSGAGNFARAATSAADYLGVYADAESGATGVATVTASAQPQDFFLLYGASYLQWEIIIELNYFFKSFVPRQEGNLASPEKQRDLAWNNLLEWDSYMVDSNISKYRG